MSRLSRMLGKKMFSVYFPQLFRYFKRALKKITVFFLLLCFGLTAVFPCAAQGAELDLTAESAILVDAHSGKVLYEKDPHKKLYPASMTKLMTMVLAMEALQAQRVKMEDVVTASEHAASFRGSRIFLTAGEQLSFKEMLLGVALASGNDAAVAVAEHVAGSHEAFVELMNQKAAELGMKNTHFVNCNGLHDPEHYTTAADFALLGRYALNFPELLELCSIKHYRIREDTKCPFQYDNKNKLLWFYPGTDGFKTGWTEEAKYCFVGTCLRNNLRLISVVLGVPAPKGHFAETQKLFNYGFSQFAFREFYQKDEVVGEVKVGKGLTEGLKAVPEEKVGITLPRGEEQKVQAEVELLPLVNAPVQKGQVVGHVSIVKDDEVLQRTNLIAAEEVPKGSYWKMVRKVFRGLLAGKSNLDQSMQAEKSVLVDKSILAAMVK